MSETTTEKQRNSNLNPFRGPELEKVIEITQAQEEIWIACTIGGDDANRGYNESISLNLKGKLNHSALEKALNRFVNRHESLRSVFSPNGRFMMTFKEIKISLIHKDISHLSNEEKQIERKYFRQNDANHVFNLTKGPLLKACLIKFSEQEFELILTAHHIICDGWSMGIMQQELGYLYSAIVKNESIDLKSPDSFLAYADEQLELMESDEFKKIENFWIQQFKDSVPNLTLPADFPYPKVRTYESNRLDFSINQNLLPKIKKIGLDTKCSFVTTILAAFDIFLFKITNQNDIVVGLPAAGQSASGMTHLIGHCVNLLPIRAKLNTTLSFNQYLKEKNYSVFDAYDHQQLSFGQLLKKLSISRDPSRVPLAPIMFNIDLGMSDGVHFHELDYTLISNPRNYEIFEIFLNASGTEDDLTFEWSYNTSIFKQETIEQMMHSFENIIQNLVNNPEKPLSELFNSEYQNLYTKFNNTKAAYPNKPLHLLIKEQCELSPNKIALEFKNDKVTYQKLQHSINKFAQHFINQGIKPGDFVAVALPNSLELLYTLIGILQCGAAYVPLDPKYPHARLEFMLEDSGANYLITNINLSESFPNSVKHIIVEHILTDLKTDMVSSQNININTEDFAYMLYTSGSTGKPKGVTITHKNLVNFLFSMAIKPGIKGDDRLLSITTISFDISGLELFLPLLNGATLVLTDSETARDGRLLLELLAQKNISILQATPTSWKMLVESGWKNALPLKALCGGENLPSDLSKKILSKCNSLWNMYGPTETTVWSSVKQISPSDDIITIGKPIANTQIYILNEQKQLLPEGAIGEIAIGGDGVANGYWNRQDLTSEKFIKDPFSSHENAKLYFTGDLGKLLLSGEMQCLGRIDQQIKIRGHRIELGEIEQTLNKIEGIQEAIVSANSNALVASILPQENVIITNDMIDQWKIRLKTELPAHLIPIKFNIIDKIPKTLNGKLDRNALSKPSENNKPVFTKPRTKTEQVVANIWQKCLEVNEIDIFSDFFELGGHSLTAVKVMTLIEEETGKRLPLASLFEYSTIEKLAQLLNLDSQFITWDSLVPIKAKGYKAPLYIVHGAGMNVLIFNALAKNLDDSQPVYGLQAKGLNGIDEPFGTVEEIAQHYVETIIKSNPNGPYALAGYSFGGIIAYEMARQMIAKNKKITMVGLLDTDVYPTYYYKSFFRKKLAKIVYQIKNSIFVIKQMLTSGEHTKERFNSKKESIGNILLALKNGRQKQHEIRYSQPYKLDKMNNIAMNKYHIKPQDIKVDLFRVESDIYYRHDNTYLGWKDIALKGVAVHDIPGNHNELFSPPNDKNSAEILQHVLDQRYSSF